LCHRVQPPPPSRRGSFLIKTFKKNVAHAGKKNSPPPPPPTGECPEHPLLLPVKCSENPVLRGKKLRVSVDFT